MSQESTSITPDDPQQMSSEDSHYLKEELYQLVREDPAIFDFLQDGSLDGIWYWDLKNLEHEWMSPRFWEVFGYDPKEKPHLAEAWQDMINPDDLKTALDNFQKHCEDPEHPYDQLVRYRHQSGSTVWVRCRGLVIRDGEGNPVRMLGAHSEVTVLKETEEALEKKAEELERSNAELEQFAYVASHDLQEPLRMVTSFMGLLEEEYKDELDEEAQEYIEFAVDGANRMQTLITDLLAFSRVGTHGEEFVPTDCTPVFEQAMANLKMSIEECNAVITHNTLPTVMGDEGQLTQLFQNLIGNALKYRTEEPPQIQVSTEQKGNEWVFSIQDNGIGIDPEYAERIFVIFQRLHSRDNYLGTGIGLAICKKTVERHGGRIWVESEEGKGSTFYFTIPQQGATSSGPT